MIVHLTETELADDIHTVLARVRDEGLEVIVEQDHRPVAIIRRPGRPWAQAERVHRYREGVRRQPRLCAGSGRRFRGGRSSSH
jgi:hypothetical protein